MQDVVNRLYFVSAEQAGESARHNALAHEELIQRLRSDGMGFTEVEGSYNGIRENSVMLKGGPELEKYVFGLAERFGQESFLTVWYDGHSELTFARTGSGFEAGQRRSIGKWTETSQNEAMGLAGWTKIGDRYFSVK